MKSQLKALLEEEESSRALLKSEVEQSQARQRTLLAELSERRSSTSAASIRLSLETHLQADLDPLRSEIYSLRLAVQDEASKSDRLEEEIKNLGNLNPAIDRGSHALVHDPEIRPLLEEMKETRKSIAAVRGDVDKLAGQLSSGPLLAHRAMRAQEASIAERVDVLSRAKGELESLVADFDRRCASHEANIRRQTDSEQRQLLRMRASTEERSLRLDRRVSEQQREVFQLKEELKMTSGRNPIFEFYPKYHDEIRGLQEELSSSELSVSSLTKLLAIRNSR